MSSQTSSNGFLSSLDHWVDARSHPLAIEISPGFPWTICAIVMVYLAFALKIGPDMMKHREPFRLQGLMRLYNVINIIACTYVFLMGLWITSGLTAVWQCTDSRDLGTPLWALNSFSLGYIALKVFDLLDTVFFVLRKKFNQITVLHVVHHSIMPLTTMLAFKVCQSSFCGNLVTLNSFIHMVMYTYYLLSSYPDMQPYLWWKKHLTALQLVQFTVLLIHATYFILFQDCPGAHAMPYLQIAEAGYFVYAFGQFYIKTYSTMKPKAQ
ncbi:Elongation of very long chain fatty acids protein 1 [Halotydeus destructor]|nr:Elongation of very long chain fatty acids protein 1 [Halotydeus destructor]